MYIYIYIYIYIYVRPRHQRLHGGAAVSAPGREAAPKVRRLRLFLLRLSLLGFSLLRLPPISLLKIYLYTKIH